MNARLAAVTVLCIAATVRSAVLEVGQDKPFSRPEHALAKAHEGDEIVVYPLPDNKPYPRVALMVRAPKLTIRSVNPHNTIKFDGEGFDYSGRGPVPRAIVQFDPAASGCTLEGFDLANARNQSFNGAGVRINAANDITIRRCSIHDNDMGIMSNGRLDEKTASNQFIDGCVITHNGSDKDPGYNHNLYLGGTSVTVRGCEIAFSTTGHNLKSRAHFNWIEYNFIHDSSNRELDLVDEKGNTDAPDSDTVLLGNIMQKKMQTNGNKAVIHFGRDGKAAHTGRVYLVHNSITTPFASPVLDLSSATGAMLINNRIADGEAGSAGTLVAVHEGVKIETAIGKGNVIAKSFAAKLPASVKAGEPAEWDEIDLPWQDGRRSLMQFLQAGSVVPRTTHGAGAK